MKLLKITGLLVLGIVIISGIVTALSDDAGTDPNQSGVPDYLETYATYEGNYSTVEGADVIWEGGVTLTEGETFTVTIPAEPPKTYEISSTTGLGALDAAAKAGSVTYRMSDREGTAEGLIIWSINGINNQYERGDLSWYQWVIGIRRTGTFYSNGFPDQGVIDDDTVDVMYCKLSPEINNRLVLEEIVYAVILDVSVDGVPQPTPTQTTQPTPTQTTQPTPTQTTQPTPTQTTQPTPTQTTQPTPTQTTQPTPTQTTQPTPLQITLGPGWNFVSTPKYLAEGSDTAAIFSEVETAGHSIYTYDPETSFAALNASDAIGPLDGIWVYANISANVPLTYETGPVQAPPTKRLRAGWNAIGCTDAEEISATDGLISVRDGWSHLIGFNATTQAYETAILNGDTGMLTPTRGYWIFMTEDGTLAAVSA